MTIRHAIGQWLVPPAFKAIIRRCQLKSGKEANDPKDINVTLDFNDLLHISRYQFARNHHNGNTVLDAACGSGYGSELLDPVEDYTGIDYADYCISYARNHHDAKHRSFIEGDLNELDKIFSQRTFDTIVSFETLEHLAHPEQVLSSFFNLLKSQGRLIMSIPLNHPDQVYHKRIYTYQDICYLVGNFASANEFMLEEYLQDRLQFFPLTKEPLPGVQGVWLGILTKGMIKNN